MRELWVRREIDREGGSEFDKTGVVVRAQPERATVGRLIKLLQGVWRTGRRTLSIAKPGAQRF